MTIKFAKTIDFDFSTVMVLSVLQPHAWAIVAGPKRFENRSWQCTYRGTLLIHAGKGKTYLDPYDDEPDEREYFAQPAVEDLAFGSIIGVVRMVGCLRPEAIAAREGRIWQCVEGPWCHEYTERRWFRHPIPARGALGLWRPPVALRGRIVEEVQTSIESLTTPAAVTPERVREIAARHRPEGWLF